MSESTGIEVKVARLEVTQDEHGRQIAKGNTLIERLTDVVTGMRLDMRAMSVKIALGTGLVVALAEWAVKKLGG